VLYEVFMERTLSSAWESVLDQIRVWARTNSPWLIHFNSGSCNGCDIEILATLTPRYDLERLGARLQGSPRHADILIVTGPVTRQARTRLERTYEQMPDPKFVIVVGSCGLTGGVFHGSYNIAGGVDEIIPVDAFVPGCPPRPDAIIFGIMTLLNSLKKAKS
jgi:NADH-quinone oxidoreductase B subunit